MMETTVVDDLVDWLRDRPQVIRDLCLRLPPGCKVKPLRPLTCPMFEGVVVSYTEDGSVSVVEEGNPIRGYCNPDWLEVVPGGPCSREDVEAALARLPPIPKTED